MWMITIDYDCKNAIYTVRMDYRVYFPKYLIYIKNSFFQLQKTITQSNFIPLTRVRLKWRNDSISKFGGTFEIHPYIPE